MVLLTSNLNSGGGQVVHSHFLLTLHPGEPRGK